MVGKSMMEVRFGPLVRPARALGLSPDTIRTGSTAREGFLRRFWNSTVTALASMALTLGGCAACGVSRSSYRFGFMRNCDISLFFLSQLIRPTVVLVPRFLVLNQAPGRLDTRIGLILLGTLTVHPVVIGFVLERHIIKGMGAGTVKCRRRGLRRRMPPAEVFSPR